MSDSPLAFELLKAWCLEEVRKNELITIEALWKKSPEKTKSELQQALSALWEEGLVWQNPWERWALAHTKTTPTGKHDHP